MIIVAGEMAFCLAKLWIEGLSKNLSGLEDLTGLRKDLTSLRKDLTTLRKDSES